MARRGGASIQRTTYATFRGADFSTDPSIVESYRSPLCTNIVADAGGMPQKRRGYRTLHRLDGEVNGIFTGIFGGVEKKLVHAGTKLYAWDEDMEPVQLMTGLPNRKSRGVYMQGKLWIVTGGKYIVYDGTTAEDVAGSESAYIPTTVITRMPTGGGTPYEDVNMLTPYRKNAFQTDGEATEFLLDSEADADGTVRVWVWDEEITSGWSLSEDRSSILFTTAPAAPSAGQADGLVVQFPHTVEGYTDCIDKCTIITTYGVGNNDRIIVSGNPELPNTDWMSGLDDPGYFPDLLYTVAGSENTAIKGYLRVGSQLAVVKEDDGKDSTVYLRSVSTDESGEVRIQQVQAIAAVGSRAAGSFATLMDDPMFLSDTGIRAIASQTWTSEKITQGRSYYIDPRLTAEESMQAAEAVVWNGMYILGLPNGHCYVLDGRQQRGYRSENGAYNYECYYWENVPARIWCADKTEDGEYLYFGTEDGRLCKVNSDIVGVTAYSDDGEAIDAVWATKYDDDGTPAVMKTMLKRGCCVTIKPYARSSATVYIRSDRTAGTEKKTSGKTMDILDFSDIDFERFTFNTDDSPQEIFLNRKLKNYKRLQIIARNSEPDEGFGIFKITKHYVYGNYAKR